MDKDQLHFLLSDKSNTVFEKKLVQDIESTAKAYPYFASIQFANFSTKENNTTTDIAKLALFKGDPYLFACFIKNNQKKFEIPEKKNKEDILTLINELPNTNPIAATKEKRELQISSGPDIVKNKITTPSSNTELQNAKEEDKSLMVMMSFTDWLSHFKTKAERDKQEDKDKKALKTAWQKEKLAAATEEENEEIPEEIFKQAMNSISENTIISESLAIVLAKQGKTDKAVDMYKKLSLRNPEKNRYFADRIKELTTLKDY